MLTGMRKVPALVTVFGLTVAGCGFSSVDPDSSVAISGRALDSSGKPLRNARVLLVKQADLGEVIFGSILTVGTLSAICFAPDPPAICEKARTTTTDADGRYHFEVKGSDTQGSLGTEATMNVVFSGRSAKTSTTVSFTAKENTVSVPDARLWDLAATASRGGGGIRLSWRPLSRSAGTKASYSAQLYDARTGSALWTQPASGGHAEIDPRLLEDLRGSVAVSAGTELTGGSGVADVRASYLSPRLPVAASAGAPPSRGRPCAAMTGSAPAVVRPRTPCGETDGDLTRPARLTASGQGTVSGVVVDLGRVRPVGLVVARGFSGQFLVETSTDGQAFTTVATGFGPAYAVRPSGAPGARYVRLRSPVGLDESLSAEVSVW
jgi:hypothetical protein